MNGVAAKILAKRAPIAVNGCLQWKADHSTFSALNLESKGGAIQQPAKRMVRPLLQASTPNCDKAGTCNTDTAPDQSVASKPGKCSTDATSDRSVSTNATVTVDSSPGVGISSNIEENVADFTHFRKLAQQLRGSTSPSNIPLELETLRTADRAESKATSSMYAASFARMVSSDSTSTQITLDGHGVPFSREPSTSTA